MIPSACYTSPIGPIWLATDGASLTGLWFDGQKYAPDRFGTTRTSSSSHPVFDEVFRWLDIYFSGRQPAFLPPLSLSGTHFQTVIWQHLLAIPFGQTITYSELARRSAHSLRRPSMSAQAVGQAVAHNPVSIIVPCHRVMGADGCLTGYAGGLDRKLFLLRLESASKSPKLFDTALKTQNLT